jgi:hypothetical protein
MAFAAAAAFVAGSAHGEIVSWTNWTAATIASNGSATGTLATPGGPVGVSYSGDVNIRVQTDGVTGFDYWRDDDAYRSTLVENGPGESGPGFTGNTDIITLTGQDLAPITNTITFSSPVTNPILAVLSLGQPNIPVTYQFNTDFSILSSGQGYFGGSPSGSLFRDGVGLLRGSEGNGVILFSGTYTSISFTVSRAEFWHGFQVGVVPTPTGLASLGLACVGLGRRRRSR